MNSIAKYIREESLKEEKIITVSFRRIKLDDEQEKI